MNRSFVATTRGEETGHRERKALQYAFAFKDISLSQLTLRGGTFIDQHAACRRLDDPYAIYANGEIFSYFLADISPAVGRRYHLDDQFWRYVQKSGRRPLRQPLMGPKGHLS